MSLDVCIVAGEASGDLHGALLVRALRERAGPGAFRFWGAAGDALVAEGVEPVVHARDIAVMGFAEVLAHYDVLSHEFRKLREALEERRPHVVILVDYPGFNLGFAERARALGCVVLWHIAPKTWAHGAGRNETLARCTDALSCLLPFEERYFTKRGARARFVGNPLFDGVRTFLAKRGEGVDGGSLARVLAARDPALLALLPGSRRAEIRHVLPPLVDAFLALRAVPEYAGIRGVIPVAPTVSLEQVGHVVCEAAHRAGLTEVEVRRYLTVEHGGAYEALSTCAYAWVCSGTATLEAALLGAPLSVVFRMSHPTFLIARAIVKLPYVSLVNLCAEKRIAHEFIQHQATVRALVDDARRMLENQGGARAAQQSAFDALRARFPAGAARIAADFFLDTLEESPLARGLGSLPDAEVMATRSLPARRSLADEDLRARVRRWSFLRRGNAS